eukprot:scaffold47414_cov29-Tisochrysis_lutea.AAC.9
MTGTGFAHASPPRQLDASPVNTRDNGCLHIAPVVFIDLRARSSSASSGWTPSASYTWHVVST